MAVVALIEMTSIDPLDAVPWLPNGRGRVEDVVFPALFVFFNSTTTWDPKGLIKGTHL